MQNVPAAKLIVASENISAYAEYSKVVVIIGMSMTENVGFQALNVRSQNTN